LQESRGTLNPAADVTELLRLWSDGDAHARDALMGVVYDELRRIAARQLRREARGESLCPTGIVHDVYLRLIDQERAPAQNRGHFFALAAHTVRRVLVDHARARLAQKRGSGGVHVTLSEGDTPEHVETLDVTSLDDALTRLAVLDERQARLVELRFFGGLSIEETAEVLEISTGTVKREWRFARTWLRRELSRTG